MSQTITLQQTSAIDQLVYLCHQNAVLHGFYEDESVNHVLIKMALVVTELSEVIEGFRNGKGIKPDEHCPDFSNEEIEVADSIIRLLDYAGWRNLRLGQALQAKHAYNVGRPYKHNKSC